MLKYVGVFHIHCGAQMLNKFLLGLTFCLLVLIIVLVFILVGVFLRPLM
jgi:hypothetical protein